MDAFHKVGPYVNYADSIEDDLTDPIVEAEALAAEKEFAKKMQKQQKQQQTKECSGDQAKAPEETTTELSQRGSSDSESVDFGPFQTMTGGLSGHVISNPYELSHYPIEILENKTALQRMISNRLNDVVPPPPTPLGNCSIPSPVTSSRSTPKRASSALGHHSTGGVIATCPSDCSSLSNSSSKIATNALRRLSLQSQQHQTRLESIREQHRFGSVTGTGSGGTATPILLTESEPKQSANETGIDTTGTLAIPIASLVPSNNFSQYQEKQAGTVLDDFDREPQHVEMHSFRDAIDVNYQRMGLTGEELSGVPLEDLHSAARSLVEALRLRSEYMQLIGNEFPTTTRDFLNGKYPSELPKCRRKNTESYRLSASMSYNPPEPPKDHWGLKDPLPVFEQKYALKREHGTVSVIDPTIDGILTELKKYYVSREKYLKDFAWLNRICNEGPLKTFCYRRLTFLQTHFQLHVLLNEQLESAEQKSVPHRDFYNIRKVDTHIHAASSMNHKHLLRFIKKKMRTDANEVVQVKNGQKMTMAELFEQMGIRAYDLSVDMLDVHADRNTFHRFDKFNTKYNPIGQNELREIFIKTDNYVEGRYFAEVLKEVLSDLEDSKYQHMEPRLSVYGRAKDEWDKLAHWAIHHDVWSPNVRWMVQIPRLYDVYRCKQLLDNFDKFLDNVFTPLFEVTNDPNTHPALHHFLKHVSGIDSVDDESKHEHVPFTKDSPEPDKYVGEENPSYSYYLFYMYANLTALNAFRRLRGLNTFALRPHSGEAGHVNHLSVAYLTSESIAHGLLLRKVPVLQYLFYLSQTGIAMSPLSNNHLFLTYQRNPLPEFLMKGLNVSLSTDDPLQFHITKEALMEEYSIAAQVWKLSSCDMCELARNSILQSGFEDWVKVYWLGPNFQEEGVLGNDVSRTNVPDIRVSFRHESLVNELCNLFKALSF